MIEFIILFRTLLNMITSSKKMGFTRVDKFLRLEPKDDDDLSLVDEILPIVLLKYEAGETVKLVSKRWRKAFLELSSLDNGWPSYVKVHAWHLESHLMESLTEGRERSELDDWVTWTFDPRVQWRLTTQTLCRHVFEKLEEIRCSAEREPERYEMRSCTLGFPSKEEALRQPVRWGCHVKSVNVNPMTWYDPPEDSDRCPILIKSQWHLHGLSKW